MKIMLKLYSLILITALFSGNTFSSVIINGTRVIYPGDQREVTIQLTNNGNSPSLIQSWVDEGNLEATPENSKAPFIVSPPISRIEPSNGQALRLSLTTSSLPQNKESLFWLNILEIPPMPTKEKASSTGPDNFLQMAFRTRIKLFYRPIGLKGDANSSPEKLIWSAEGNGIRVKNPTPFYVSFTEINAIVNNKKISLTSNGDMLAPGEEKYLSSAKNSARIGNIEFTTINDFGGRVAHKKSQLN